MIATSFTARIVSRETDNYLSYFSWCSLFIYSTRTQLMFFVLFLFFYYFSLYIFFIYFLCRVRFIFSITARARYVLFNQSSLFIVTRTVYSLSNV